MTEDEIKELSALLDRYEAHVKSVIDYCNNSKTIMDACKKGSLRKVNETAKEKTHLVFQTLTALEMSGITMKSVGQVQSELLACAVMLRQIADRITLGVWSEKT